MGVSSFVLCFCIFITCPLLKKRLISDPLVGSENSVFSLLGSMAIYLIGK